MHLFLAELFPSRDVPRTMAASSIGGEKIERHSFWKGYQFKCPKMVASSIGGEKIERHSFWKGYQFKCPEKEEMYSKRYEAPISCGCKIWSLTRLAFAVATPLSYLTYGEEPVFYLAYVPGALLALVSLLLVSCYATARKYTPLIISVAVILEAVASAMIIHVHTSKELARLYREDLSLVTPAITAEAGKQLDIFLRYHTSYDMINSQMSFQIPQVWPSRLSCVCSKKSVSACVVHCPDGRTSV